MIQDVVALEAQLRLHPLGDRHVLGQGHIPVPESWTVKSIAHIIRGLAKWRVDESALVAYVWVSPSRRECAGRATASGRRSVGITHLIAPCGDAGSLSVQGSANLIGMSGLER